MRWLLALGIAVICSADVYGMRKDTESDQMDEETKDYVQENESVKEGDVASFGFGTPVANIRNIQKTGAFSMPSTRPVPNKYKLCFVSKTMNLEFLWPSAISFNEVVRSPDVANLAVVEKEFKSKVFELQGDNACEYKSSEIFSGTHDKIPNSMVKTADDVIDDLLVWLERNELRLVLRSNLTDTSRALKLSFREPKMGSISQIEYKVTVNDCDDLLGGIVDVENPLCCLPATKFPIEISASVSQLPHGAILIIKAEENIGCISRAMFCCRRLIHRLYGVAPTIQESDLVIGDETRRRGRKPSRNELEQ